LKLLLSCCITSFLLVANSALADSDTRKGPNSLDLGIGYKQYAMNLPSRVSASKNDDTNKFPALALIATDDINEYVSIRFEVTKGLEDARSGYDFSIDAPINPIKIKETYTAELDYSLSVAAKFSLLTNSPIQPFLILGGNTSAVSYDYEQTLSESITDEESKTLTSSGIMYGAGLEWITYDNIELLLSYENLSHFKYDAYALSFNIIFEF
jgi:opacity protein-like surface antigen